MGNEFGQIMQLVYVVHDVAEAAAEWAQRVGAGPFYVIDRLAMDRYYLRGARTKVELCLGFGYWGSMQVELIHPLGRTDSLYRQALESAPGELNHCATVVTDIERLLAARGLQDRVIQSGTMPSGLKFVYLALPARSCPGTVLHRPNPEAQRPGTLRRNSRDNRFARLVRPVQRSPDD